jgi:hypothetical protein
MILEYRAMMKFVQNAKAAVQAGVQANRKLGEGL